MQMTAGRWNYHSGFLKWEWAIAEEGGKKRKKRFGRDVEVGKKIGTSTLSTKIEKTRHV